ncbi:MAG: aminotransferase class IV, partial [Bradymonadaceae bacterium]
MAIQADKIWMDGELIDFENAQIHVLTHSLHYGLGAFEGIRCYERADGRRAIFRLREHIRRLFETCKIAMIDVPWDQNEIELACAETVRTNKFTDCYIRPLVFLGHGEMGL